MAATTRPGSAYRGFTLIELMLVLVLVALLAGIATPIVFNSINEAKESALKENLLVMRKAIDGYYADTRKYPDSLQTLVDKHYIRSVPSDPITERSDTWVVDDQGEGIVDIHSGSEEVDSEGIPYRNW